MARRFYANFAPTLTLAGAINAVVASFTVATNFSGWPASTPFYAVLEYGTTNAEIVLVTAVVGSVATVSRGQDGTTAVSHAAGSAVDFAFVKADLDEASAHVNASAGVHGIAGAVVGTTDSQTLTNKTYSGGTWTGTVAAAGLTLTSPTINTATLNTPTAVGSASLPALVTKQGAGGVTKIQAWQDSTTAEKGSVDSSGNATFTGVVTAASFSGTGASKPGDIKATAALALESGWLDCDGSAVSRATFANLYAALCKAEKVGSLVASGFAGAWVGTLTVASSTGWAIGDRVSGPGFDNNLDPNCNIINTIPNGTTIGFVSSSVGVDPFSNTTSQTYVVAPFGNGNGTTTFNVPDLRDRFPRGAVAPTGSINDLGVTGGAATHSHTLSTNGWALYQFTTTILEATKVTVPSWTGNSAATYTGGSTSPAASSSAVALGGATDIGGVLPPFVNLRYIIKT